MTTTAQKLEAARSQLAQLEEQHTATERARAERVRTARRDLAERRWKDTTSAPAAMRRDAAEQAWTAIVANSDATLEDLFRAWQELRITSAVRFDEARQIAAKADQHLGIATNAIGVEVPRPRPAHDPLVVDDLPGQVWTFDAALAQVVMARSAAATAAARAEQDAEEDALITEAEKDPA